MRAPAALLPGPPRPTPTLARVAATALAAAALALGLGACGGGGGGESSTASTETRAATGGGSQGGGAAGEAGAAGREASAGKQGGGAKKAGAKGKGGSARVDLSTDPARIRGARVTSTGAVQTLPPSARDQASAQHNSYASIRAFGAAAEGSEATDISFALLQYLSAKAEADWATACARLYSVLRESVERQPGAAGQGCPAAFGDLMKTVPRSVLAEQAKIDVSSVRREGDKAFVIYKTPDTLSADMPMRLDGGVWVMGAIEAYALRPGEAG